MLQGQIKEDLRTLNHLNTSSTNKRFKVLQNE